MPQHAHRPWPVAQRARQRQRRLTHGVGGLRLTALGQQAALHGQGLDTLRIRAGGFGQHAALGQRLVAEVAMLQRAHPQAAGLEAGVVQAGGGIGLGGLGMERGFLVQACGALGPQGRCGEGVARPRRHTALQPVRGHAHRLGAACGQPVGTLHMHPTRHHRRHAAARGIGHQVMGEGLVAQHLRGLQLAPGPSRKACAAGGDSVGRCASSQRRDGSGPAASSSVAASVKCRSSSTTVVMPCSTSSASTAASSAPGRNGAGAGVDAAPGVVSGAVTGVVTGAAPVAICASASRAAVAGPPGRSQRVGAASQLGQQAALAQAGLAFDQGGAAIGPGAQHGSAFAIPPGQHRRALQAHRQAGGRCGRSRCRHGAAAHGVGQRQGGQGGRAAMAGGQPGAQAVEHGQPGSGLGCSHGVAQRLGLLQDGGSALVSRRRCSHWRAPPAWGHAALQRIAVLRSWAGRRHASVTRPGRAGALPVRARGAAPRPALPPSA